MKIVNSIKELKSYLAEEKRNNKQIGFVPTMGALHDGHLSLVERCVKEITPYLPESEIATGCGVR